MKFKYYQFEWSNITYSNLISSFFDLKSVQLVCRPGNTAAFSVSKSFQLKKPVASMAGDHYWFIHWKQFILARFTGQVWVGLCVSSFYISSLWVWVGEPASASTEQQKPTPVPNSAEENTMKTFSCAPQDCFWPQKPCRRKHKPTSLPLCVCWNVWLYFHVCG